MPYEHTCGTYVHDHRCVECCARLALSARPRKDFAERFLEVISKSPGAVSRAAILNRMREKINELSAK